MRCIEYSTWNLYNCPSYLPSTEPKRIRTDSIRSILIPRIECEDEGLGKDSGEELKVS
jgi:hypothetical protein